MYAIGANMCDPACELSLAAWYMTGIEGVLKKDERKAFALTEAAAKQGLPRAHFTLGYFFEQGIGVEANVEAALSHYQVAAEKGGHREQLFLTLEGEERAATRLREVFPRVQPQSGSKEKQLGGFFNSLFK